MTHDNSSETTEVWYCWRVRVDERLLVPRSDPHVYESAVDMLWTTEDEARAWRDEELDAWDEPDEKSYIESWILCRETLQVVGGTPFFVSDTPRNRFLCDVFITALEGGIGYWSQAIEYHWTLPDTDTKSVDESMDIDGFFANIVDGEDGDKDHHIDAAVIERGLARIVSGEIKQLRSDIRATVMLINLTNGDEGDYDAETADCIVQAGLFGEVVYG